MKAQSDWEQWETIALTGLVPYKEYAKALLYSQFQQGGGMKVLLFSHGRSNNDVFAPFMRVMVKETDGDNDPQGDR